MPNWSEGSLKLKENKEEIIKVAADRLAERLAKTKKVKEILNNLEDQNG